MSYKSAIVYWFLDETPKPGALEFEKLRRWEPVNMEITEGSICEGLWLDRGKTKKYFPCMILRLEPVKDAKALEQRYLKLEKDVLDYAEQGKKQTEKAVEKLKTTIKQLSTLHALSSATSGNQQKRKRPLKSNPSDPVSSASKKRSLAAPTTAAVTPPSPVHILEQTESRLLFSAPSASALRTPSPEPVRVGQKEAAPPLLRARVISTQTTEDIDVFKLKECVEQLTMDVSGLQRGLAANKDQTVLLVAKNLELGKKIQRMEKAGAKAEIDEDDKILVEMKKHAREADAIKAGILHVFKPDDLVFGVLSARGLAQSPIARYILDEKRIELVQSAMIRWCMFREKPEMKPEIFRTKLGTMLETAKTNYRKQDAVAGPAAESVVADRSDSEPAE